MNSKLLSGLMTLLLLTSCAGGVSSDTKSKCLVLPNVKQYSQSNMDSVAKEIEQGKSPKSTEMLKDYKVMRDETRIAKNKLCG